MRQVELADRLGITQPFVSQLLNGKRPWPDEVRERAEALLNKQNGRTKWETTG